MSLSNWYFELLTISNLGDVKNRKYAWHLIFFRHKYKLTWHLFGNVGKLEPGWKRGGNAKRQVLSGDGKKQGKKMISVGQARHWHPTWCEKCSPSHSDKRETPRSSGQRSFKIKVLLSREIRGKYIIHERDRHFDSGKGFVSAGFWNSQDGTDIDIDVRSMRR